MSNSSPLPLSQKLPIGKLASLFILGVLLTVGFWYKLSKDIESHKISYQAERAAEVREVQSRIEEKFRYVYQTIRTMSFLPGVKNIDRYGKNFDSNSKLSVQQLYNNAYINIKLSEIYLLPKTIDPDKIDPNTKKGEEPILTFDEFLTTDVITEKGEEPPPEIPEVEEYEYRLMKTQMEFFAKNFPTRDSFKDLNVPVLSGPEVITCDNAEFTKKELSEHNDEPRKGLLFTVPVYGLDRKLHGGVSAVIRSQVVREMLPEKYMALVNRSHKFIATKDNTVAFSENLNNLITANSKKSQISSGINTIEISDGSPWELVYAFDDGLFWSTPEVKDSQNLTTLLILATWTILLMLSYIVSKSHRLNLSMNRLVKDLELQSTQTESLAHTLSSSADLMNAGIQQQSSAAQETAAAMEQITSKLKQTSSNADQLVHLGEETEESALAGDGLIGTVVDSAKNLQNFANSTSEQMRELVQGLKGISNVITDIGKKTDAINEIVFQTKLLSFNASVEAARAGEAGKGFSVVAEEVGTLAQHSGTSAKEIKSSLENGIEQIENIISKNSSIIESFLSKNAELISHVIDSAEQCRESFTTIMEKFRWSTKCPKKSRQQLLSNSEVSKSPIKRFHSSMKWLKKTPVKMIMSFNRLTN